MFSIHFELDVDSVQAEVDRLESALDREVRIALAQICDDVASEAQQSHPYQNRTGLLEASTQAGDITGAFLAGTLEGEVLGNTEYGEFVNDRPGFEFLEPAFQRVEPKTEQILQGAVEQAAGSSGW